MDIQALDGPLTAAQAKARLLNWAAQHDALKATRELPDRRVMTGVAVGGAVLLGLMAARRCAFGRRLLSFAVLAPVVKWGLPIVAKAAMRSLVKAGTAA